MRNTLNAECLVQALQNVIEAKSEHDKARDEHHNGGGYSWGYYGRHYVERMESAAEEFQKTLDAYIDARIAIKESV